MSKETAADTSVPSQSSSIVNSHRSHKVYRKRKIDSIPVVRVPRRTIGGLCDRVPRAKQCNCRKSNCLKLYCDCFQYGIYCSSICTCNACFNQPARFFRDLRTGAIIGALERTPRAFRPRILSVDVHGHTRDEGAEEKLSNSLRRTGCKCRKSNCLKKYCDCFQATIPCNPAICKCQDCYNKIGNKRRETIIAHDLKKGKIRPGQGKAGPSQDPASVALDMSLPPLVYSNPVKFQNGITYNSLCFSTTRSDETAVPVYLETNKVASRTPDNCDAKESHIRHETELELAWRKERIRMRQIFVPAIHEIRIMRSGEQQSDLVNDQKLPSVDSVEKSSLLKTIKPHIDQLQNAILQAQNKMVATLNQTRGPGIDDTAKVNTGAASRRVQSAPPSNFASMNGSLQGSESIKVESPTQAEHRINKMSPVTVTDTKQPLVTIESPERETIANSAPPELFEKQDSTKSHKEDCALLKQSGNRVTQGGVSGNTSVGFCGSDNSTSMDQQAEKANSGDLVLECSEELEEEALLSPAAVRELTILAAQDTSLLRTMNSMLRKKALELARQRLQR